MIYIYEREKKYQFMIISYLLWKLLEESPSILATSIPSLDSYLDIIAPSIIPSSRAHNGRLSRTRLIEMTHMNTGSYHKLVY